VYLLCCQYFALKFWTTFGGFDRKMLPDIWRVEKNVVTLWGENFKIP
jgi:hypothetical protein